MLLQFIFLLMLQTRLKYEICPLHDQPLNLICLHSQCTDDRLICVLCRQDHHSQLHMTMPIKLYLSQKAQQLKCLTKSKLQLIQHSLHEQKQIIKNSLSNLAREVSELITKIQGQWSNYIDDKVRILKQCEGIINNVQFQVDDMRELEEMLRIVGNYQEYGQEMASQIANSKNIILKAMSDIQIRQSNKNYQWAGHSSFKITQNVLESKQNSYKVAYYSKPITKFFNRCTFRIIHSPKQWMAIGIAHLPILNSRQFNFRYYTIGHGVYAISSNGGIWSHNHSQFNNKLGGIKFEQGEIVSVKFDDKLRRVCFENQAGDRLGMDVEMPNRNNGGNGLSKQKDSGDNDLKHESTGDWGLRFCAILYYQGDRLEIIDNLRLIN